MDKPGDKDRDKLGESQDTSSSETGSRHSSSAEIYGGDTISNEDKKAIFLDKVKQSNEACQNGDFQKATRLYTETISLDPTNHVLYSNRSAAFIKMQQYEKALQDAVTAKELCPKWAKAYYRQGLALQHLGRHADSLAAFSSGLSQDPKSLQLLEGLVDAAIKSPLKATLEPTYKQLEKMKLEKSPFVVISVIGQELLAAGYHGSSLTVLESALKIGTCSLKLRGSVFSALSSAHWGLGNIDKAISYMQQDLSVAKSLGDNEGECRAHGNLGSAYFSKANFKEALAHNRFQLVLAMKQKDRKVAANALSSLGHVYSAIGDYPNALASHKQCVVLTRQLNDKLFEAREIGNVGAVYLSMGDFDNALECHKQHLAVAKELQNKNEEARAYSNLGSAYHFKRKFQHAVQYHTQVLQIAKELEDRTVEARAYAGLGHAARCMGDLERAKHCHEQQLNIGLSTKDKVMEGRACSNLGIIYQQQGQYDTALKLHKAHLTIVHELEDRPGQGRAFGNMGNAYSALGQFEEAVKYHKQELAISKEVDDRSSEACTQGNLAIAYQSLGFRDKALEHYHCHLSVARELKDKPSEARALSNLGNFYSAQGEFSNSVPYYEQFLALCKDMCDTEGEGRAYHYLGYAHYSLGTFKDAVHFYEQDLALARKMQDKVSMGRAYCNLGLAHKTLGNYDEAFDCQKFFLTVAHQLKNTPGKFRAMGNLGDICMAKNEVNNAIKFYEQQLVLATNVRNKNLEATAYGMLGSAHRKVGKLDQALTYHTQELKMFKELNNLKGTCKAHGHLGAVYTSLAKFTEAYMCYEDQLETSQELKETLTEAQAFGNLGITKMNMGNFEDALGHFEQQLATLEQVTNQNGVVDRGRAYGNMGECYEALCDFDEAVKNYEQCLVIAQKTNNANDQDRAYRGLGNAHRAMGNLQQALVCFEKRLVVAHELNNVSAKGSAYGELGCLHSLLGNFEQAISCLEHQLKIAQEMRDRGGEADAACGLGGVYQQMGEYDKAVQYHQMDLTIAEDMNNPSCQGRAYGNLGVTHESLGNYEQAILYQEQHLSIAAQMNDRVAKTLAYSSLGRIHHALANYPQAVTYLQQGLHIADQLGRKEDEAKIRHRLGLALWANGSLEDSQHQLYKAAELFENIRRELQFSNDYRLNLFDLQTASYQALQRVLVELGRHNEALAVAERGRTRAFVDLLMERQTGKSDNLSDAMDSMLMTTDQIVEAVKKQSSTVIYYSIAAGHLYMWIITPKQGVVKFNECHLSDLELDSEGAPDSSSSSESNTSMNTIMNSTTSTQLDQYIQYARDSLGVDVSPVLGRGEIASETESEADDILQQHLDEISRKISAESGESNDAVQRSHVLSGSSHSLNSLFSQLSGSYGGRDTVRRRRVWSGKPPLKTLYDLLIGPLEDALPKQNGPDTPPRELILVLQGDLHLVPFGVLKGSSSQACLFERFKLRVVPSLRALNASIKTNQQQTYSSSTLPALIIGNPKLPQSAKQRWGWGSLVNAEQEARIVGDIVGIKPLIGSAATKEMVLKTICQAECIHFATHISWKLSAIILSPSEYTMPSKGSSRMHSDESDLDSNSDMPALNEFLLTAADILNLELSAKLVVLSAHNHDLRIGQITSDGLIGLVRAFLTAGAQAVVVPLWPVKEVSSKLLMREFYTHLLQGTVTSYALNEAMRSVHAVKQYSHPANWAGFMVIGGDVKLSNKTMMFGNALGEVLSTPTKCREAMRVLLHLVEKSLQRIHRGQRNPMYTTQQSIMKKVGPVSGWRELLLSVGFKFEATSKDIPASVFFPQADPGERLMKASASLQALLGLSAEMIIGLSRLLRAPETAYGIIRLLKTAIARYNKDSSLQVTLSAQQWKTHGCHEFLAALGFDLIGYANDEVLLHSGKQGSKRMLHFALQSMLAVFDPSEALKALPLEPSSSLESLTSSKSGPSISAVSLSASSLSGMSIISSHSLKGSSGMNRQDDSQRRSSGHYPMERSPYMPTSHSTPYGLSRDDYGYCAVHGRRNASTHSLDSDIEFTPKTSSILSSTSSLEDVVRTSDHDKPKKYGSNEKLLEKSKTRKGSPSSGSTNFAFQNNEEEEDIFAGSTRTRGPKPKAKKATTISPVGGRPRLGSSGTPSPVNRSKIGSAGGQDSIRNSPNNQYSPTTAALSLGGNRPSAFVKPTTAKTSTTPTGPEAIALKVLCDTRKHMEAVEMMQRQVSPGHNTLCIAEEPEIEESSVIIDNDIEITEMIDEEDEQDNEDLYFSERSSNAYDITPTNSESGRGVKKMSVKPQMQRNRVSEDLSDTDTASTVTERKVNKPSVSSQHSGLTPPDTPPPKYQPPSPGKSKTTPLKPVPPPLKAKPPKSVYQKSLKETELKHEDARLEIRRHTGSSVTPMRKVKADHEAVSPRESPAEGKPTQVPKSSYQAPQHLTNGPAMKPVKAELKTSAVSPQEYMSPPDYRNSYKGHLDRSPEYPSYLNRPGSSASTTSSMYSSTSSIPSIIYNPNGRGPLPANMRSDQTELRRYGSHSRDGSFSSQSSSGSMNKPRSRQPLRADILEDAALVVDASDLSLPPDIGLGNSEQNNSPNTAITNKGLNFYKHTNGGPNYMKVMPTSHQNGPTKPSCNSQKSSKDSKLQSSIC
uniref:Tetratricopeptide repeat protein 28-like n=1 Tax=Saccoglossus kowalevskii TaxID=10224 RepID=A0ABM0GNG1_SACKO|nr:PREDICTED: tetratricopeptide repeat protein 28-like [Saccoglossus kowalevskii]